MKRQRIINDEISTHTPLARRDKPGDPFDSRYIDFYSHASCEA